MTLLVYRVTRVPVCKTARGARVLAATSHACRGVEFDAQGGVFLLSLLASARWCLMCVYIWIKKGLLWLTRGLEAMLIYTSHGIISD